MKNIKVKATLLIFSLIYFAACSNQNSQREADEKALSLMQNSCFACHSPDMTSGKRVAPPMFMIRNHYYDTLITKEEFIEKIITYVNNPSEELSIMPGAVRNFGLMPKQTFKEEDLKLIAGYIYDNDLQSDEWYANWEKFKKEVKPKMAEYSYEDMGLTYANGTKSQLGKNLLAAIKEYGAAGAVEFCNTRAITLTDSMASVYNVTIKRVSDKPRNQSNTANESEIAVINEMKKKLSNGEKPTPEIVEQDGKMIGYYAIETNKMCLQCHGNTGKEILPETSEKIKQLYPADKATGYGENQIRGIWVVKMDKK